MVGKKANSKFAGAGGNRSLSDAQGKGNGMKISFNNPSSKRLLASVWHNDELHTLKNGETINLNVKRGDKITYKVGALSATHTLNYQSPNGTFVIEMERRVQMFVFGVIFLAILALYFTNMLDDKVIASVMAVIMLVGYEGALYFKGYKATVVH